MRVTERTVYSCDHCGRHRLTRSAIEKHEPKCVRNPQRRCGWCKSGPRDVDVPALAAELTGRAPLADADLAWLRDQVGGCPMCMLAVIVQSGLSGYDRAIFVYPAEVERFRAEERLADRGSPW